jgi:hypothetical protein
MGFGLRHCATLLRMAEYKKHLLTYLDIMGFRDLIQESTKDPTKVDAIRKILELTRRKMDIGLNVSTHGTAKTANFSDLIIRARPLTGEHQTVDWVNYELLHLAAIQSEITCRYGILLRGGISISDLYMENNMVFGPALVRSYELESELALYPRIVIDPAIIALKHRGLLFNTYRMQGDDGVFFVNYLYGRFREIHKVIAGFEDKFKLVAAHRKVAKAKLKEGHSKSERVLRKFIWLALYHNAVLKEIVAQAEADQKPRFMGLHISDEEIDNPSY